LLNGLITVIKKIEVILGKSNNDVSFLKSTDFKIGDGRIISNKENIIKLVAYYLINEKDLNGLPVGDVTRFHLRNGASINDIIINADISEAGFKRSFGVMVNYLYELNDIEKNIVVCSPLYFIPNSLVKIIKKKWNNRT
jgi:malonyl-CoA decarboxylase